MALNVILNLLENLSPEARAKMSEGLDAVEKLAMTSGQPGMPKINPLDRWDALVRLRHVVDLLGSEANRDVVQITCGLIAKSILAVINHKSFDAWCALPRRSQSDDIIRGLPEPAVRGMDEINGYYAEAQDNFRRLICGMDDAGVAGVVETISRHGINIQDIAKVNAAVTHKHSVLVITGTKYLVLYIEE
jgi:hypothetical protein